VRENIEMFLNFTLIAILLFGMGAILISLWSDI